VLLLPLVLCAPAASTSYADWAKSHGADFHPSVRFGAPGRSTSLRTEGPVGSGEVLATVPLKTKGAAATENDQLFAMHMGVVADYPTLANALARGQETENFTPVILLAVVIMYERRVLGEVSSWAPMLNEWPDEASASTVFWPSEDIDGLKGSSVYDATTERVASLKTVHAQLLPLLAEPQLVPGAEGSGATENPVFADGFPFANFACAVNLVISRSFITETSSQYTKTVPIIVPVFEALARTSAIDATYETRDGAIVLVARRDFNAGEEIRIFTGHKSNAKWMVDYGTFVRGNQHSSVPLSVRIGDDDLIADLKVRALNRLNHTYGDAFALTAMDSGRPPVDLLRTMRILFLDLHEFHLARKVLSSDEPVGLANELKVLRALNQACSSLLGKFANATLESEQEIIERVSTESTKISPMRRDLVGAHVRFEEKRILYLHLLWAKATWEKFLTVDMAALDQLSEFPH
jgi:hypothetical protein